MSDQEKEFWLNEAMEIHFSKPQVAEKSDIYLNGADILSELDFYCAIGEAVNGEQGYFGFDLNSLRDCSVGGFGAKPPFTIFVKNSEIFLSSLNHHAAFLWAIRTANSSRWMTLNSEGLIDESAVNFIQDVLINAPNRKGPTMFDMIAEAIGINGSRFNLK